MKKILIILITVFLMVPNFVFAEDGTRSVNVNVNFTGNKELPDDVRTHLLYDLKTDSELTIRFVADMHVDMTKERQLVFDLSRDGVPYTRPLTVSYSAPDTSGTVESSNGRVIIPLTKDGDTVITGIPDGVAYNATIDGSHTSRTYIDGEKQLIYKNDIGTIGVTDVIQFYCNNEWPPTCFSDDTHVITKDGPARIDSISIGDRVLAKNIETGQNGYAEVIDVIKGEANEYFRITAGDETFRVTGDHEMYSGGTFVPVRDLKAGDELLLSTGETVEITSIESVSETISVRNLQMESAYSNFYVTDSGFLSGHYSKGVIPVKGATRSSATAFEIPIEIAQRYIAPNDRIGDIFHYTITPVDEAPPIAGSSNGVYSFQMDGVPNKTEKLGLQLNISFSESGTYSYEIKTTDTANAPLYPDDKIYVLTFLVYDTYDGGLGIAETRIYVDEVKRNGIRFDHEYVSTSGPPGPRPAPRVGSPADNEPGAEEDGSEESDSKEQVEEPEAEPKEVEEAEPKETEPEKTELAEPETEEAEEPASDESVSEKLFSLFVDTAYAETDDHITEEIVLEGDAWTKNDREWTAAVDIPSDAYNVRAYEEEPEGFTGDHISAETAAHEDNGVMTITNAASTITVAGAKMWNVGEEPIEPETETDTFTTIAVYRGSVLNYCTDTLNDKGAFVVTASPALATHWHREDAGNGNVYFYTVINGVNKYMVNTTGNEMGLSETPSTAFTITDAGNGKVYVKKSDEDKWLQWSKSGNGMRLWAGIETAVNCQLVVTDHTETVIISNAPELTPITTEESLAENIDTRIQLHVVKSGNNVYFTNTLNANNAFEVTTNQASAAFWYFEEASNGNYRIYTYVNDEKKYLVSVPSTYLADLSDNNGSEFTITSAGNGSFHIKLVDKEKWFQYSNTGGGIRFYQSVIQDPENGEIFLEMMPGGVALPNSITVHLLRNGQVYDTVTVTKHDGWQFSFEDLPAEDEDGVPYEYSISEEPIEHFVASYSDGENSSDTPTEGYYNITNTYQKDPLPIPTGVRKTQKGLLLICMAFILLIGGKNAWNTLGRMVRDHN